MSILELLILAVSLAMDAFAVSVCKGLETSDVSWRQAVYCGVWFGGFQALMPCIGYFLGASFDRYIEAFDHWVAFGLLALIGINMIRESFDKESEVKPSFSVPTMAMLAVATSIDALAVGISLAFLSVSLPVAAVVIGTVTFAISFAGVMIGKRIGGKLAGKAGMIGGIVLILIGLRILLTSL